MTWQWLIGAGVVVVIVAYVVIAIHHSRDDGDRVLAVVEERDRAVLQLIRESRGGRTIRELNISRPEDSQAALDAAVTRLKLKKLIETDDGGRWTAA